VAHNRALVREGSPLTVEEARPNKRLKLPGRDRSKGSGVLCPVGHELTFNINAPCGRVARSLSAVR